MDGLSTASVTLLKFGEILTSSKLASAEGPHVVVLSFSHSHHSVSTVTFCGDEDAKSTVEQLISDIGLEPVYLGGTDRVDLVEGMTDMWFNLALKQRMGRRIAFKLLT